MATRFTLKISRLRLSKILMISAIILIAVFQVYWINKLYGQEKDNLQKETDVAFRDVIYKLQIERFRKDTAFFKNNIPDNLFLFNVLDSVKEKSIDSALSKHLNVKGREVTISISTDAHHGFINNDSFVRGMDSTEGPLPLPGDGGSQRVVKYFSTKNGLTTPLDIKTIDSAYKKELLKNNIDVPYRIMTKKQVDANSMPPWPWQIQTGLSYVGLSHNDGYMASFDNPFTYLLGKIKLQILFALLLLGFTTIAFIFLYRNLLAQQKLAAVKNEFISNITHELKTPIATVNVAIEALRNFNALQNPERTREYLDISALELQRLSMLVDKVLKLSMFENKEIELNKETIDLHQLVAEVIASMKLQLDKAGAYIQLTKEGNDFSLKADKLHITSVLFNLLDNALKYSKEKPAITVHLADEGKMITLSVSDNGIGIAPAYKDKIFEKFFRVPSGDHHNIKGYGLGLSYVHHIIMKHYGTISVESTEGKGSTFIIKLLKA